MTELEFREKAEKEDWNQEYVESTIQMVEQAKKTGEPYIPYERVMAPPKVTCFP